MTRNELFQYITENNLKEDVKKAFKKAYNSVSTEELNKFVENQINFNKEKEQHKVTGHPSLSRNECFDAIKTLHYEANIKALYGKPYNSVSTDKLNEFIKNELIEKGNIKFVDVIEAAKETITTPANSSNMSYKELKEFVKTNNLQEFVKSFYGKNYTNLSTEELRVIYDKANNTNESTTILKEGIDNIKEEFIDIKARKVLTSLCTILNQKDLLKLLN